MTTEQLSALLNDVSRLHAAVNDPAQLAALPQTIETMRALPLEMQAFQVRWFLHCGEKGMAYLREEHPEVIKRRSFGGGGGYVYCKKELCKATGKPYYEYGSEKGVTAKSL